MKFNIEESDTELLEKDICVDFLLVGWWRLLFCFFGSVELNWFSGPDIVVGIVEQWEELVGYKGRIDLNTSGFPQDPGGCKLQTRAEENITRLR